MRDAFFTSNESASLVNHYVVTCCQSDQITMHTTEHTKHPADKMRDYRARLRAAGLRPLQIWVPDTRMPRLAKQARRQSLLASSKASEQEVSAFIDGAVDLGSPE